MFNRLSKLFLSRQIATAPDAAPVEPVIIREDFTIADSDQMPIRELLHELRRRTIEFTEHNNLSWGATDFILRDVLVRVKLTEVQDVVYVINGLSTFDLKEAIAMVKAQQVF